MDTLSHPAWTTNRIRKLLSVLTALLCLLLSMTACAGSGNGEDASADPDPVTQGENSDSTDKQEEGYRLLEIWSDSMSPVLKAGDLIVVDTQFGDPSDLQVGDIIVIPVKGISDENPLLCAHRIIEINSEDGELVFSTKGDNNSAADSFPLTGEEIVAVYRYKLEGLGALAGLFQYPFLENN